MALNPFEQLVMFVAEPRQAFEDNVALILRATIPGSRRVRVFKGDGGIDVYSGTLGDGGMADVYQIKYMSSPWGDSQKQQIRESYQTARDSSDFQLGKWFLCTPSRLPKVDLRWFDEWRKKQANEIDVMDGDNLTEELQKPACSAAREQLKGWGVHAPMGSGPRLAPEAFICKQGLPPGTLYAIGVQLRNLGDQSAKGLRVLMSHSETGCTPNAPVESIWTHEQTGTLKLYNPWALSCRRSVNPGEVFVVLEIPCIATTALPFKISLEIWAEDYPHVTARIEISRAHVDAPMVCIPFSPDSHA